MGSVKSKGFTLLEMLFVIFLLGLIGTLVMGTLPSSHRESIKTQERIITLLRHTAERATLESKVFGMVIVPGGWEIVELIKKPTLADSWKADDFIQGYFWQVASLGNKRLRYSVSAQLELAVTVEGGTYSSIENINDIKKTQIIFLPGGEVTDFKLSLSVLPDIKEKSSESKQTDVFEFTSTELMLMRGSIP